MNLRNNGKIEFDQVIKIFTNLQLGMLVMDKNKIIVDANIIAARSLGFRTHKKLINKKYQDAFKENKIFNSQEDRIKLKDLPIIRAYKGERNPQSIVGLQYRKNNFKKWFILKATRVFENSKEWNNIIVSLENVTYHVEDEKRRVMALGSINHEIRNMLSNIKAFTELLRIKTEKYKDKKINSYLQKVDYHVDMLTKFVTELIHATKVKTGKLEINKNVVDFDELISSTLTTIIPTIKTHTVIIKGTTHKKISADENRIKQVIHNLISNAVKYSPKANKVDVRLRHNEDNVILKIKDYGIGISKKNLNKIFLPYYRSRKNKTPGLGVGLYIAQEIVKKHSGFIQVKSKIGKGSVFIVYLPIYKSED